MNIASEEFEEKFKTGSRLAFQRMLEEKKKNDGYLVFQKDGKIIKIKARDFKPEE